MYILIFTALTILFSLGHILLKKTPKPQMPLIILMYLLVFMAGFSSFYAGLGHLFRSDYVAHYIGWPAGNLFQWEIAYANFALGLLGVLCFWFRDRFMLATSLAYTVFLFGAAHTHLYDIFARGNYAPGNAGIVLYADILIPIIIISLLILNKISTKKYTKE
ncbi:hypothetical protein HOC37_04260 [bacterium]|jgi:hypothetical protein|nr:hypothetical protein [bacterium]MBT3582088.1 hypothetical protein [bacterium]MBT4552178.1 hypothetical protein [bacterium]MBT7088063.1 hypothetical protein [bacterium]